MKMNVLLFDNIVGTKLLLLSLKIFYIDFASPCLILFEELILITIVNIILKVFNSFNNVTLLKRKRRENQ